MEEPTPTGSLQLHEGHSSGHVSVSWARLDGNWVAITSGSDGKLVARHPRQAQELKAATNTDKAAVHCLSITQDNNMAATGDEKGYVRTWQLPGLTPSSSGGATRFAQRASCCSWSKDGKLLAAASDDGQVKLITVPENKVLRVLRAEGTALRGLAVDPEGAYVAAAASDGGLWLWEAADGAQAHRARGLAAKVDHTSSSTRVPLAWHPDGGTVLAVPGREHDVVLLERLSWRPLEHGGYLAGGHDSSVTALAFSPNGIYLASGDGGGKVAVWMVDKAMQVSCQSAPAGISSIAWHPQNNALLLGCADGQYALWVAPLPQQQQGGGDAAAASQLPSPWQPIDDVLKEADAAAADAVKVDDAGDDELADYDDDDDDADGGGAAVIKRRGLKTNAAGPAASAGGGDSLAGALDDILDDLDAAAEAAAGGSSKQRPDPALLLARRPPAPKPQGPVHPGSTPANAAAGGGGGGRFLAYNQLGCVVSKAVDDHHVVEVSFHDTSKHRARVPTLTDFYGFMAAGLGPRGVAYISRAAGPEQPSMLVYRCFESWTPGSDWSVALPEGEEAAVVAAGHSVVAVATSRRLLRLYSHAGRQLAVLALQGQPVALATPDPGHLSDPSPLAAASQHLLGLVWAQGPPSAACGTQQLAYEVYDVSRAAQCYSGPLVLSPGASLAWLGFSREGLLAAMDSAGVLRVRSPEWGGSWVPLLDAASAKASTGADVPLWPAWLEGGSLMAVVNSSKAPHPQVSPRPLITPVPLGVPGAPADAAPGGALEEEGLRLGLAAAAAKAAADAADDAVDGEGLSAELQAQRTEADKAGLRLFNAYLKAGRQGRALELVGALHNIRSIEGALKLANHHHLPSLAQHISTFLEQRLDWEQQQQQQALLEQQQQLHSLAAAGDDMQTQQDQHDPPTTAGDDAPAAPKAGSGGGSGGGRQQAAAGFTAAAGRAGTAAAAGQKRKPVGIDAVAVGKGGGGGNPFARKKVAK